MAVVSSPTRVWTYYARRRLCWIAISTLLLAGFAWVTWEFSPNRQAGKAFQRFLAAAENRDWNKVRSMMAANYHDHWGLDREAAIEGAGEALRNFVILGIAADQPAIRWKDNEAVILARIRLTGRGTGLAEIIIDRVNTLPEPFQFEWRRETWQPWSWKLVSISQPGLQLDPGMFP